MNQPLAKSLTETFSPLEILVATQTPWEDIKNIGDNLENANKGKVIDEDCHEQNVFLKPLLVTEISESVMMSKSITFRTCQEILIIERA